MNTMPERLHQLVALNCAAAKEGKDLKAEEVTESVAYIREFAASPEVVLKALQNYGDAAREGTSSHIQIAGHVLMVDRIYQRASGKVWGTIRCRRHYRKPSRAPTPFRRGDTAHPSGVASSGELLCGQW